MLRRVAVVAYHASPLVEPGAGDAGGMTVYVREVAESLAELGLHTDVFTRATADSRPVSWLAPGVRVLSIDAGPRAPISKDALRTYVGDFASGIGAFALGQRVRYDVVHSHYWQSGLAGLSLARAWDAPFVHSQHTLARVKNQFLAPGDVPESASRIRGEDEVMDAADVLIASTDEEWRQLSCLYGVSHDRLKTVHPGVDHDLFRPGDPASARAELGLGDEAVMLYAGRLQPLKGLSLALRALERLVRELSRDVVFLVVGGASGEAGEEEVTRLRALADTLGVADRVRFLGPQPHARLPLFYRAADVVVVCSHSESFGLSALEAHACGTPVVATAVGGLSHIVRDGVSGFLVDSRDPAEFAARLRSLLEGDGLRASLSAAAVHAARRFSWDATSATLFELYECLVREGWPQACTC
jgi:D-inositol-3-phosphate glycosyltransferase